MTELLRDRTGEQPGIPEAMEKVTEVYEMTMEEIKKMSHVSNAARLAVFDQVFGASENPHG